LKFSNTRNFFPPASTTTFTVPLVEWALLVNVPVNRLVTAVGKVSVMLFGVLEQPFKKSRNMIAAEIKVLFIKINLEVR
jgi:CBS-domain-containing membrane protein